MSESIFETFTDERGNISVRISQEVQVLTREEANRIEAEYRRMQADNAKLREQIDAAHMSRLLTENENAKLRELVSGLEHCSQGFACDCCPLYDPSNTNHRRCESLEHELGIEVAE